MNHRVLFVLSADFGEYVNATVFSRNQSFDRHMTLPARLKPFVAADRTDISEYTDLADIQKLIENYQPSIVALCSGYLFAVNNLLTVQQVAHLHDWLKQQGIVSVTTDPWARIWALEPDAKFTIYHRDQAEPDQSLSARMNQYQQLMEAQFETTTHFFPLPINNPRDHWLSFFNPQFCNPSSTQKTRETDHWLFILSNEDLVFCQQQGDPDFATSLSNRFDALLHNQRNQVTLVAPPRLVEAIEGIAKHQDRLMLIPYCSFDEFENLIRQADIAVYWNVLSASLLYCMYHNVPTFFYSKGHQVKVCEQLYDHAVEHVYQNLPPQIVALEQDHETDCSELIHQLGLDQWVSSIRTCYANSPTPQQIVEQLTTHV